MDSFYGGRPGVSPVIKATFKYVTNLYKNDSAIDKILRKDWDNLANDADKEDKRHALQKQTMIWVPSNNSSRWPDEDTSQPYNLANNLYRDVWFDELCIIDANSKNNPNNGKIYRRTLKSDGTNPELGGYAEYIGQLNGPAGATPIVTLTGLADNEAKLRTLQEEHHEQDNGEGYFYNKSSRTVPDKDGLLASNQSLYIFNTNDQSPTNTINLVLGNEKRGTPTPEYPQGIRYNWYNYKYNDVLTNTLSTGLDTLHYGIGLEVPIVFPEIVGGPALDFTQDPEMEGESVTGAPFYYRYTAKIPRGIPGGFITKIHKVVYGEGTRRPRDAGTGAGNINYPVGNYYHTLDDIEYYISEDLTDDGYPKFSGYRIKMYARKIEDGTINDNSQSCPMPFDRVLSGHNLYRVQGMNLKNFVYGHQTTKNKNSFVAKYPNLLSESMQGNSNFTVSDSAELWVCEFHYLDRFGHEIAVSDQYSESAAGFTGELTPRFYSYEDLNGHPGLKKLTEYAPAEFVLGFVSDIKNITEIKHNNITHGIRITYSSGETRDFTWPVFGGLSLVGDVTTSNRNITRQITYSYYDANGAIQSVPIGDGVNYIQELITSPIGNEWKLVVYNSSGNRTDNVRDATPTFIEPYHLLALYTDPDKRSGDALKKGTWCYHVQGNTVSASDYIYWKDLGRMRGVDQGITTDIILDRSNTDMTSGDVAEYLNNNYPNGFVGEKYAPVISARLAGPVENSVVTHFFAWNADASPKKWESLGTIQTVMVPATIFQESPATPSEAYWTAPAEDTLILTSKPIPTITTSSNKFISKPWKSS